MEMRIFKSGTKTEEELEYEKEFIAKAQKAAEHNSSKNYNTPWTKKWKQCIRRKAIPIYRVDNKTKEILESFSSMNLAAASIGMRNDNFSAAMIDRPIYKPILIKGKWFIKQSHYGKWKETL